MKSMEIKSSEVLAKLDQATRGASFPLDDLYMKCLIETASGNQIVIRSDFDRSEIVLASGDQVTKYFTLLGYL